MRGFIYKFCIEERYCYFGFSRDLKRREFYHRNNLEELWNLEINDEGDFAKFIKGGTNLNFETRYYKMFAFLISKGLLPSDFTFEKIRETDKLSNGGSLERIYASRGLFNGLDPKIGLTKKDSFWKTYKTKKEIEEIYMNWGYTKND